jgi:hypothetical protein
MSRGSSGVGLREREDVADAAADEGVLVAAKKEPGPLVQLDNREVDDAPARVVNALAEKKRVEAGGDGAAEPASQRP